jgi:hypothetical protein
VFSGEGMSYTYTNGDMVEMIDVVFVCRDWLGEPKPQASEVTELHWFSIDELPDDISPPVRKSIDTYVKMRKGRGY